MITPHPICRSLSCLFITTCLLLAFSFSTRAFFPTNARSPLGVLGKTHQTITDEAITELDREFFGQQTGSMRDAIKEIWRANADVDDDQKTAAKHFDGESLPEGQARIIDLRESVILALQKNDGQGARIALGGVLHTIQDFYSHTNWVELGNTVPHPGLGRPGNALDRLAAAIRTCQDCIHRTFACNDCTRNLITTGLTSGYYGGEDPPFGVKPPGKCSHGGFTDTSAYRKEGINKDSSSCLIPGLGTISPHNFLHESGPLNVGSYRGSKNG